MLFVPSNESVCPYFMIGIRESDVISTPELSDSKYCVTTLLAPTNPKDFFDKKEVVIPTQILISDNNKFSKSTATAEEKLQLITLYKNIVNEFQISNNLNIAADYESVLNDQVKVLSRKR